MDHVTASPAVLVADVSQERAHRAGKRRADLRQAIWEASQSMGTDEIADFVGGVLCEIDTDAP